MQPQTQSRRFDKPSRLGLTSEEEAEVPVLKQLLVDQPRGLNGEERAEQQAVQKRLVIRDDEQLFGRMHRALHVNPEEQFKDELN